MATLLADDGCARRLLVFVVDNRQVLEMGIGLGSCTFLKIRVSMKGEELTGWYVAIVKHNEA